MIATTGVSFGDWMTRRSTERPHGSLPYLASRSEIATRDFVPDGLCAL